MAEELDAVRYALNGNGSTLSADEELDAVAVVVPVALLFGYELVRI